MRRFGFVEEVRFNAGRVSHISERSTLFPYRPTFQIYMRQEELEIPS